MKLRMKLPPPIPNSIKDGGFNALALMFFLVGTYSLLWNAPFRNATVALVAAAFCALMGNSDRFKIKFLLLTVFRDESQRSDATSGAERPVVSRAAVVGNDKPAFTDTGA